MKHATCYYIWKGNWRILIAQNVCTLCKRMYDILPKPPAMSINSICGDVGQFSILRKIYWQSKPIFGFLTRAHSFIRVKLNWKQRVRFISWFFFARLMLNKLAALWVWLKLMSTLQLISIHLIDFCFAETAKMRISFFLPLRRTCCFIN